MNDSSNFHGTSGPPSRDAAEPSLAERARTLMQAGGHSSLATMSRKHDGYPFASVMPYAIDPQGRPIFLISQMAMHTKNVLSEPRATLLVAEIAASPLGAARISVVGDVGKIGEDAEKQKCAESYLNTHPEARQWASYGDFDYYRMDIRDVYFIGGFGVMGWVTAEDYANATADPLLDSAANILEHMNDDHVDALIRLAKSELGIAADSARMTAVDRYGFNLMMQTSEGVRGGRIAFPKQVSSSEETRSALVDMVRSS